MVWVHIPAGNIEAAIKNFRRKIQREGIFRKLKLCRHFESNAAKKIRKRQEAQRKRRKY